MARISRNTPAQPRRSGPTGNSQRTAHEASHRTANNATRESILQAARQRFLHYGFKKTTIDEIAGDAGVGKGTVYLYFEGKDEIMFTLVLNVKRSITQQMQVIASESEPADEKLERMMLCSILTAYDACTTSAHGNELVEDFRLQMQQCPRLCDSFRTEHAAQLELLGTVISEGQSDGSLAEGDTAQAARLLTTAFGSFYPPYLKTVQPVFRDRVEIEAAIRELFRFIMTGLRQRQAPVARDQR